MPTSSSHDVRPLPVPLGYNIIVDVQGTQGPFNDRGVAKTVAELSCALVRIGAPVVGLVMNPELPATPPWFAELVAQPTLTWATAAEVRRLEALGPAVCLIASPMEGSQPVDAIWPPYLAAMPFVPLLFDAIPYADPLAYGRQFADRRLHATRPFWLDHAAHNLAISRAAADQWEELVGPCEGGVTPIGMGVSPFYQPADDREAAFAELVADQPAITKPFVLYVGGNDARKNVDGAIRAWARVPNAVREHHQFVVACSASEETQRTWLEVARESGLGPTEVVTTGFVSEATLRLLYQTAELHFFASHSEGFGMPIVEGIACGCPAISSNTTSMPEVVGWLPGLFDPTDTAAMAALVTRSLTDSAFRSELVAACQAALPRHSWERAAQRTLAALASHVPTPRHRSPRPRRLAIVAPDNPTVIAPLTRLLDAVGALFPDGEIDLFGSGNDVVGRDQVTPFPLGAFGRTLAPHGYDDLIYLLPNDASAAPAYDDACRWPGLVWLVDGTMSRITLGWGADRFTGFLNRWYPGHVPSAVRYGTPTEQLLATHGMLTVREVASRANRVLVDSDALQVAVRRELMLVRNLPIDVVDEQFDFANVLSGLTT